MAATPTHEPCGYGHEKPIGQACSICTALVIAERKNEQERERQDRLAERKRMELEAEAKRKGERA